MILRIGGEEFVIILLNINVSEMEYLVEKIWCKVEKIDVLIVVFGFVIIIFVGIVNYDGRNYLNLNELLNVVD